jgi:alanyl-tRNA synthetase
VITANEIRQKFLDYFAANGHQPVSSSSLVPRDDPSLLFTNAGMVQFKRVFLGQEHPGYLRATTSQKCLRVGGKHNDLENVGRTARHHTFFEMLGNFSFGDYFKEQAIHFAWEFLTKELALDKSRLYATVYKDDEEAIGLWQKVADLPLERIFKLGDKDNFWSMGDTGPCGPCSEIIYDQGEHLGCGPDCGIGKCDCDRFLEIWNLVFMQYDQLEPGRREPLPKPSIDTGMGLERITAVCQGVSSNYDIDIFQELIAHTAEAAGVSYHKDEDTDTALRVIADHSRSIAFMIADGILPSNEGRGYVLRRLIRRAFRFGRLMGLLEPFLFKTVGEVTDKMGQAFPELEASRAFMARVVREEEDRFGLTLDKGLLILEEELAAMRADGGKTVSGDFAFKLYDTYGFPLDIVNDVAGKAGFVVDEKGFQTRMAEQKERARAAWKGSGEAGLGSRFAALLEEGVRSEFAGYEGAPVTSRVIALLDEAGAQADTLGAGAKGWLVTTTTPFYGESGGQVGDKGAVKTPSGAAQVTDTLKPEQSLTVHQILVSEGEILLDQEASLSISTNLRRATERNHTATHLLHAALRKTLGEHVKQAGSLVSPDRLRFDFTHISGMTQDEIEAVEREANEAVLANIPLNVAEMAQTDAVAAGAMALFGEKYGDVVRVVSIPEVSVELCGGAHVRATGEIGPIMILSESGVAAGVRRIEAATGFNTLERQRLQRREVNEAAAALKCSPHELAARVKAAQTENKKLIKDMERLASKAASAKGGDIMDNLVEINGVKALIARVEAPSVKALRELMDDVRSKLPSGVACLAAAIDGKAPLILSVSKDLHARFTAPVLIKDVAAAVGGSGGGRPDMAQAGGANPEGIPAAFEVLRGLLARG